ncbi:MAG: DnaJ domain-containing protein [Pyrinomonadaceae bacterium]
MTPQSELEIHGNFLTHPFAELLVEIAEARLHGSLRVSDEDKKCVVYFISGRIVFAVSNGRSTRLFEMLLQRGKLTKEALVKIPNFASDFDLTAHLQENDILTKAECDALFTEQIQGILIEILGWESGDWTFSSLARIRDGLAFPINTNRLIIDYGRNMPVDLMLGRFRSLNESFRRSDITEIDCDLSRDEAFVLSRAEDGLLTAADLLNVAAMSEESALHSIYTLWLGGLLFRDNWQSAIPKSSIAAMNGAVLALRNQAQQREIPRSEVVEKPSAPKPSTTPVTKPADPEPEITITLDEYLDRVSNAATYYDILGVDIKAEADELKQAYFLLAKNFHPDRYHSVGGETLKLIQSAFTELAQAHETLKNTESREMYDYRMRKELVEREKRLSAGDNFVYSEKAEKGAENFERGLSILTEDDIDGALPYLARAAHLDPKNARYHAYYGKALSFDDTQRHKAESEMQAAIKIDPNNAAFRIMLAEFFIKYNLLKRAEGELTRLLAIYPNDREARDLLESLQK